MNNYNKRIPGASNWLRRARNPKPPAPLLSQADLTLDTLGYAPDPHPPAAPDPDRGLHPDLPQQPRLDR